MNWNGEKFLKSVPTKDQFMNELEILCKKFDVSIGHEDIHGAFILYHGFSDSRMNWLRNATLPDWEEGE